MSKAITQPDNTDSTIADILDWFIGRPQGHQPIEITRAIGRKRYVADRIQALITTEANRLADERVRELIAGRHG